MARYQFCLSFIPFVKTTSWPIILYCFTVVCLIIDVAGSPHLKYLSG